MSISIPGTPFTLQTTTLLPPTPIHVVTAVTYTFGLADAQAFVIFNSGSTQTATIPLGFPVGAQITCVQLGAGQLVVNAALGGALFPTASIISLGQYALLGFIQFDLNQWIAFGRF
jgi:hypothetical protein